MQFRVAAAATVVLTLSAPAAVRSQGEDLDTATRQSIVRNIYALVQQYFAHWEGTPRSEVENAYRDYTREALQATARKDFDLATLKFVARLRNGHSQFTDSQADGRPLKFRLLEVEGRWVVVASQESRLPRGIVVRTIDGQPVEDFVRNAARYIAASNVRLARTHVFSDPILFSEQISVGLQNGEFVIVNRAVRGDAVAPAPTGLPEARWLREGQIAYVRVPSFADSSNENKTIEMLHQFASAPALVIDVRGNGGGTTPQRLIGTLMNRTWRTWEVIAPPRPSLSQQPPEGSYAGRLFILVDRFCGSACEDFVMPFKDNGRAVIIGETTQGSSGNPYRTDLGHGMSIAIGAVRYRFPNGDSFEGVGIVPDVLVERRVADIAAGRDAVLDRAQELAGR